MAMKIATIQNSIALACIFRIDIESTTYDH